MNNLLEFQKNRIKKRCNLNFEQELENQTESKIKFSKNFSKELEIFIDKLYNNGVMFFGFDIKMPYLANTKHDVWGLVHLKVEQWLELFSKEIELVEFCYISLEKQKLKNCIYSESLPCLYGIIGVRTILGHNKELIIEVKKIFYSLMGEVNVKKLAKKKEIKQWWNFCTKENNFRFHRFVQYSENFSEYYGRISDLELNFDDGYAFGLDQQLNSLTKDVSGIKNCNPDLKTINLYLLNLFMWHADLRVYQNNVYVKIKDAKYSWKFLDKLSFFNVFFIQILEKLKLYYPQQLQHLNPMSFITDKSFALILENSNYLPKIKFKYNAIEFKDGIYFGETKRFYSFKKRINNINHKMKNHNCLVFFNKNYSYMKKKTPELFVESITISESKELDFDVIFK